MVACRALSALFACALLAAPLAAQPTHFGDTIEVRVINVDAVVTGPDGIPVRGLGRDEFELLVNGKPVPIDYFSAVEEGLATFSGAGSSPDASPADTTATEKPYLALLWDQRALMPKDSNRLLEGLVERLPELNDATRGILVARQGRSLGIEQSFTQDVGLLAEAIRRLSDGPAFPFSRGSRSLLVSRIERAPDPREAVTVEQAQLIEDQATQLLQEVKIQAQEERDEAEGRLRQLRQLIGLLSNLPGRKSVLYLGQGIQTRPAEAVYQIWWSKYRSIAPRLGVRSIRSHSDLTEITSKFAELTRTANNHRVAFYAHDTGGRQPTASLVEHRTIEATTSFAGDWTDQQQNLFGLATSTGGLGSLNVAGIAPILASLVRDMRSYYSLGFEVTDTTPEGGRIKVRVRLPDLKVRHFDRFDGGVIGSELERAAMTALMTARATNPLEASVEVGESSKQKNGTFLFPLLVKVPISRLALLPEADRHVGKISLVVVAQSADGNISAPAHGEVPIEIENAKLLAAMSQLAGYRLKMRVSAGEQTVVISLRDEVAQTISTLSLALGAGQGP